jgi:hypothetical protein
MENIRINNIDKTGYSNIVHIGPDAHSDSDSEEDQLISVLVTSFYFS